MKFIETKLRFVSYISRSSSFVSDEKKRQCTSNATSKPSQNPVIFLCRNPQTKVVSTDNSTQVRTRTKRRRKPLTLEEALGEITSGDDSGSDAKNDTERVTESGSKTVHRKETRAGMETDDNEHLKRTYTDFSAVKLTKTTLWSAMSSEQW